MTHQDPIEKIIAEALDAAHIAYRRDAPLDFMIDGWGIAIECKQFYTARADRQLAANANVILVQGRAAAEFLASSIRTRAHRQKCADAAEREAGNPGVSAYELAGRAFARQLYACVGLADDELDAAVDQFWPGWAADLAPIMAAVFLRQPSEAATQGLARDLVMWMDLNPRPTAASLFAHLESVGRAIPPWMRAEPELKIPDHVPSKATRATLIYRAMVEDILAERPAT